MFNLINNECIACMLKVLVGILFIVFLKNTASYIYQAKNDSRVYNTGNYYNSLININENYDSETFFFSYHLYLINGEISPENFKRYTFFLTLSFSFILIVLVTLETSLFWTIFISISLLVSPVFLVQLNWIGFPEHMMFFLWGIFIPLLYKKERIPGLYFYPLVFGLFIMGFWTHYYQFFISGLLILLVDSYFKKSFHIILITLFISAFFLSRVMADQLFEYHGVVQEYDRAKFALSKSIFEWYDIHRKSFPFSFWNIFNGLVFLIIYFLLYERDWIIYLLVIVSVTVTFFTYDTTRVFSNLFYPGFFYYLLLKIELEDYNKYLRYSLLLGLGLVYVLVADPFYVWGSRVIYLR